MSNIRGLADVEQSYDGYSESGDLASSLRDKLAGLSGLGKGPPGLPGLHHQATSPNQIPPWVNPDVASAFGGMLGPGVHGQSRHGSGPPMHGGASARPSVGPNLNMEYYKNFLGGIGEEVRGQAQKYQLAHLAMQHYHLAQTQHLRQQQQQLLEHGHQHGGGLPVGVGGEAGLLHLKGSAYCKHNETKTKKKGGKSSKLSTNHGRMDEGPILLPPPPPPPPPPTTEWFDEIEAKLQAFAVQLERDRMLEKTMDDDEKKGQELDRLKYAVLIQKLEEMNALHKEQLVEEQQRLRGEEAMKERERERKDLERQREMEKQAREMIMQERERDRQAMEQERRELETRWLQHQHELEEREKVRQDRERKDRQRDKDENERERAERQRERDERERERKEWDRERTNWERILKDKSVQEEHLHREKTALADTCSRLRLQQEDAQRKIQTQSEELIVLQQRHKELADRVKLSDELSDKVHQLTKERQARDDDEDKAEKQRREERGELRAREERLRRREAEMEERIRAKEKDFDDRLRRLEEDVNERLKRKDEDFQRRQRDLQVDYERKLKEFELEKQKWTEDKKRMLMELDLEREKQEKRLAERERALTRRQPVIKSTDIDSAWASGPLRRENLLTART